MENEKRSIKTDDQVTDFLTDTLELIDQDKISFEKVEAISKITDKLIKHNLTRIMNKKLSGSSKKIPFFTEQASLIDNFASNGNH